MVATITTAAGLSPAAERIDVDEHGKIVGLT
jgi:formyltetrahydrofolate synthetase